MCHQLLPGMQNQVASGYLPGSLCFSLCSIPLHVFPMEICECSIPRKGLRWLLNNSIGETLLISFDHRVMEFDATSCSKPVPFIYTLKCQLSTGFIESGSLIGGCSILGGREGISAEGQLQRFQVLFRSGVALWKASEPRG